MPKFVVTGTMTIRNAKYFVEAKNEAEAKRLVRKGLWDDSDEGESTLVRLSVQSCEQRNYF